MINLRMISPLTGSRLEYESPEDIEYYSETQDAMINIRHRTREDAIQRDINALTEDERKLFGGPITQRTIDGPWKRKV